MNKLFESIYNEASEEYNFVRRSRFEPGEWRSGWSKDETFKQARLGDATFGRPFTKDGRPTTYMKMLMAICEEPGITRKEIIRKVYGDEKAEMPGYMNTYMSAFYHEGWTDTTGKGGVYPTKKLLRYMSEHGALEMNPALDAYIQDRFDGDFSEEV